MWDNKFEELLRQYLPYLPADEPLEPTLSLREFGLDSMATVELLSALENAYQLRFEDDALTLETFATAEILWKTLDPTR
ncbi:phosphopantetheine-binding protein [Actinophytocola sp.]|uniref:phosphopantetheine-binding protein n=1 Tax=Actinophytocola sp. TaxID=1872138 RepID=UPI002ED51B5F